MCIFDRRDEADSGANSKNNEATQNHDNEYKETSNHNYSSYTYKATSINNSSHYKKTSNSSSDPNSKSNSSPNSKSNSKHKCDDRKQFWDKNDAWRTRRTDPAGCR